MALFEPLYREFRMKSEALTASFTIEEIRTIEAYFLKAIGIMNETTHKLHDTKIEQ